MPESLRIVICGKSRWDPPIRREHGLSVAAAAVGHRIDVVEQPRDVRDLAHPASLRRARTAPPLPAGVNVFSPFTPVPGHRGSLAYRSETFTLRRSLRSVLRRGPAPDAIIVNAPWNWEATAVVGAGTRRVLDLGDNWATLMPHRRDAMLAHYRRISAEADAVVVVAPSLVDLFECPVVVVPNAVAPEVLQSPPTLAAGARRMAYVGTLSERFDTGLVDEVMRRLPDWTLDLYGPCHYAGHGEGPDEALRDLLAGHSGRVRWHGLVARSRLSEVLDEADVLILPNDAGISAGQDSMKLYDYAARGRPIVATPIRLPPVAPPALWLAAEPADFADAIAGHAGVDATGNRAWAEDNSWSARLPLWLSAVTGSPA